MERSTFIDIQSASSQINNPNSDSVSYPNTRYGNSSVSKVMNGQRVLTFLPVRLHEFNQDYWEATHETPPRISSAKCRLIHPHNEDDSDLVNESNNILNSSIEESDSETGLQLEISRLEETPEKSLKDDNVTQLLSNNHRKTDLRSEMKDKLENIEEVTKSSSLEYLTANLFKTPVTKHTSLYGSQSVRQSTLRHSLIISDNPKKSSIKSQTSTAVHNTNEHKNLQMLQSVSKKNVPNYTTPKINTFDYSSITKTNHFSPKVQVLGLLKKRIKSGLSVKNMNIVESQRSNETIKKEPGNKPMIPNVQFSMAVNPTTATPLRTFQQNNPIKKPEKTFNTLTVRGKEYIVISKLGEGGSCQVFNCLEPDTLQHKAIKIVDLAVDITTANGYINEVKMLSAMQKSDHVIKMFDYEHTKHTLFVIMEKGGIDLSIFLKNISMKSARLPMYVVHYYWMEMLNCVKEIHDAGIIHSDLKPSNFLIVDGRLKLIDFGIASRLSSEMTSIIKNVKVGTFNYISPEALLDSEPSTNSSNDGRSRIKISYKSDVWSLGCILYQMVYRRTPFHNIGNALAKISVIIDPNHCIEYPEVDGVPRQLTDTMKKCLRYDMRQRLSVTELISFYHSAGA